jgi:hypothetical protein
MYQKTGYQGSSIYIAVWIPPHSKHVTIYNASHKLMVMIIPEHHMQYMLRRRDSDFLRMQSEPLNLPVKRFYRIIYLAPDKNNPTGEPR